MSYLILQTLKDSHQRASYLIPLKTPEVSSAGVILDTNEDHGRLSSAGILPDTTELKAPEDSPQRVSYLILKTPDYSPQRVSYLIPLKTPEDSPQRVSYLILTILEDSPQWPSYLILAILEDSHQWPSQCCGSKRLLFGSLVLKKIE